jgi:hypothetical protein
VTINENQRWLTIRRGTILIAGNLDKVPATIDLVGCHRLVLASDCHVRCEGGAVHLPSESIAVLESLSGDIV